MSASCFCAASRALRAAISASSALATIVGGASTTFLSLGVVWEGPEPWDGVFPDADSSPMVVPVPAFLVHPPRISIPTNPATAIMHSDRLALLFMGIIPFLSFELASVRRNDLSWRPPVVEHSGQRPCGIIIECSVGCQPFQTSPIGIDHIDIALSGARGTESHMPTVRRP